MFVGSGLEVILEIWLFIILYDFLGFFLINFNVLRCVMRNFFIILGCFFKNFEVVIIIVVGIFMYCFIWLLLSIILLFIFFFNFVF